MKLFEKRIIEFGEGWNININGKSESFQPLVGYVLPTFRKGNWIILYKDKEVIARVFAKCNFKNEKEIALTGAFPLPYMRP